MNIWKDERTYRTCSSGINSYTSSERNPDCSGAEWFKYLCGTTERREMSQLINVSEKHKLILKQCAVNIYAHKSAYLYNDMQLKNFIAVYGTSFKCWYDNELKCYCLKRKESHR